MSELRTSDKRYCTCFYMGKDDVRPDHSPDCMLKQPPLPACGTAPVVARTSKKEVPEHLVKALAQANGICTACFGKKVLPARIQWTDGRPCSIEERPCPLCQP